MLYETLKKLNCQDQLLREMIYKGLWREAVKCCDLAIAKREQDIEILEETRDELIRFIRSGLHVAGSDGVSGVEGPAGHRRESGDEGNPEPSGEK